MAFGHDHLTCPHCVEQQQKIDGFDASLAAVKILHEQTLNKSKTEYASTLTKIQQDNSEEVEALTKELNMVRDELAIVQGERERSEEDGAKLEAKLRKAQDTLDDQKIRWETMVQLLDALNIHITPPASKR